MKQWCLVALGLGLGVSGMAWAQDLNYNVVQLSDHAQMAVPQNQLTVTLVVENQASQRLAASNANTVKLNRVSQMIQEQGLQGQILNRSVYEQFDYVDGRRTFKAWQDVAQISVHSEDTAKVNRLVAAVQADARLESQQYGLTDALRRQYEQQLTAQAITNFKQQAQHITDTLGGKRYRLVELLVGEANEQAHYPQMMMAKAVAADAPAVAQDLPGEAKIQVQISGKIQVQ